MLQAVLEWEVSAFFAARMAWQSLWEFVDLPFKLWKGMSIYLMDAA